MVDQTTRLEVATVKAEQGSDILHQFANNAAGGAAIPTESGNIPALKDVILNIQQEGADKISFATTIYPSTAAGIAATTNGAIFLVRTSDPDEIYAVYQNSSGTAVDTGQRALSASAIQTAMDGGTDAAEDAQTAADQALAQTARFIAPRTTDPTTRDNGSPLQLGDQYLNTGSTPNLNRIYGTTGWYTPDVDGPALQAQIDAKMTSPMTTLGDLIRGGASGAPGRLAIGTTGQVLTVVAGQAAWQSLPVDADAAVRGSRLGLSCSANGTTVAVTTVCEQLVLESIATPGQFKTITGLNTSTNLNAGGMDTGVAPVLSQWYYLWVFWNSSTLATTTRFSLSSTAPTTPSGMTHRARVSTVRTPSTGTAIPLPFVQNDADIQMNPTAGSNMTALPIITSGVLGSLGVTLVSASTAAFFPPTSIRNRVIAYNGTAGIQVAATAAVVTAQGSAGIALTSANTAILSGVFEYAPVTANLFYAANAAGADARAFGWREAI